ncbi:hypothetical protein [Ferrimonas gelatinilytica]|uniref:hypothetical protein n=1 Tax=Ferrimonas gelatinilytica TaxID=1255257 RepID=UPI0031EA9967
MQCELERANARPQRGYKPKEVVLDLLSLALQTGIKGSHREVLESTLEQVRGHRELTDSHYQASAGNVVDKTRPGFILCEPKGRRRRWIYR